MEEIEPLTVEQIRTARLERAIRKGRRLLADETGLPIHKICTERQIRDMVKCIKPNAPTPDVEDRCPECGALNFTQCRECGYPE